jgi:hypothetical protein
MKVLMTIHLAPRTDSMVRARVQGQARRWMIGLEQARVVQGSGVTHLKYRIIRK